MYLTRDHAVHSHDATAIVNELKDQKEIIDALYRFGLGQDLRDRELFASAFAADAELDFRPAAIKAGLPIPLMSGRDTIVDTILPAPIHTTHVVSNPRVDVAGDTGRLTAIVEAQHLPQADHSRHFLMKNLYAVELVRDGHRWVMRRLVIDNVWFTGDPRVLLGE